MTSRTDAAVEVDNGLQRIESAAFAAWPAHDAMEVDGWVWRLDRGYTKRANSVSATADAKTLTQASVDAVEAAFNQKGLTPTFRLTSFAPVAESDAVLADRGYRLVEPSLVMVRRGLADEARDALTAANPTALALSANHEPETDIGLDDIGAWVRAYQAITGQDAADAVAHRQILDRIAHPCMRAVLTHAGKPLCCGLGVMVDGYLGLFDVATQLGRRGEGLAEALCRRILDWGRGEGGSTAFLQVTATNHVAIRLYERLGFEVAYEYWYRVRDWPPLPTLEGSQCQ